MAKQKPSTDPLFNNESTRRRRVLMLPRFLREEADKQAHYDEGKDFDDARAMLAKWADMEAKGQLAKKETSLDANFLNDIFGTALHYSPVERAATDGSYTLDRQFTVPGIGSADGALGLFPITAKSPCPIAVIELKDVDTDLESSVARPAVAA